MGKKDTFTKKRLSVFLAALPVFAFKVCKKLQQLLSSFKNATWVSQVIIEKRPGGAAFRLSLAPLPQELPAATLDPLIAPKIQVIRMIPHHLPLKMMMDSMFALHIKWEIKIKETLKNLIIRHIYKKRLSFFSAGLSVFAFKVCKKCQQLLSSFKNAIWVCHMITEKRPGGTAFRLSLALLPQELPAATLDPLIAPKIQVIRMVPHHLPLKTVMDSMFVLQIKWEKK
jgi:hypothetical protein